MTHSGDFIDVRGLVVRTIVGVLGEERERKQEVILHLRLHTEFLRAARTDRVEDAIDYRTVASAVLDFAKKSRFFLLETLAERVAGLVLDRFPVQGVTVTIEKPEALPQGRVSVTVHRQR